MEVGLKRRKDDDSGLDLVVFETRGKFWINSLHRALQYDNVKLVRLLLASGVDANSRGNCGYLALHWTALNGKLEYAAMLLESGASVNALDDRYHTLEDRYPTPRAPYWYAAAAKDTDMQKLLVQYGATICPEPTEDEVTQLYRTDRDLVDWTKPYKSLTKSLSVSE